MYEEYNVYSNVSNEPPKKKRKGWKVVAAIGAAVSLGLIAGVTFLGVSYFGNKFLNLNGVTSTEQASTGIEESDVVKAEVISDEDIQISVYDVSDMVSNVISSVVAINGTYTVQGMWGNTYESSVSGSGIIIGVNEEELLVVTNAHVIDDVDNIAITLYDGSEIAASVKGKKSEYDLAVLSVKLENVPSDAIFTIAQMGESGKIEVGQAAIAVGNSLGYGISVTTGCISALDKTVTVDDVDYEHLIQTDAAINPGNSGGALFNANGEVIGINSVKMSTTGVEGMGYAISVSSVMDIIQELSLKETKDKLSDDERGYLGITGITVTSSISYTYGYPEGILIRSVTEGGGADRAGLIKNDIIKSFDGEIIDSYDELLELMYYYGVGEEVEIVYYHLNNRGDFEEKTTTVTLTAKPE